MDRIAICDTSADRRDRFRDAFDEDTQLKLSSASLPEDIIDVAAGADALIVDANTAVPKSVFKALDLTVVGRAATGVDNIDVAAAAESGVQVVNVPEYSTEEVSTNAVGLLLSCLRRLPVYDRSTMAGEWDWEGGRPIHRLRGQTIGLVAFGDIAQRTAQKLEGFDVTLLAYDPYVSDGVFEEYGVESVSFEKLVAEADHLSIHAPLTAETRSLIDTEVLDQFPAHAVIVNHGRGEIVDEAALLTALEEGDIAGAGLDVLEEEPPSNSALLEHNQTIVTPHSAWYSEESMDDLVETVSRDVKRVLEGDDPLHPVDGKGP